MADVFNIDAVAPETPVLQAAEAAEQATEAVADPAITTVETVTVDDSGNTIMETVTVAFTQPDAAALTPVNGAAGEAHAGQETATTKEGKPAEVGEKRERPTEIEPGKDAAAAAENQLEKTEKETGKGVKKPKVGGAGSAEEKPAEGGAEGEKEKKKRGRPAKTTAKKPKEAAAPGEEGAKPKRPVGRPRKGTGETAEKKGAEEKTGDETRPVRSTRSKA